MSKIFEIWQEHSYFWPTPCVGCSIYEGNSKKLLDEITSTASWSIKSRDIAKLLANHVLEKYRFSNEDIIKSLEYDQVFEKRREGSRIADTTYRKNPTHTIDPHFEEIFTAQMRSKSVD